MTKQGELRTRHCEDCGDPFEARTDTARWGSCCRWKHRGRRRLKYVWTEERMAILRADYRAGVKGVPAAIAAKISDETTTRPTWEIKRKAAELGLTSGARYAENRREWTAADEAFLRKHLGKRTPHWIAKEMKRSKWAVVMKVKHLNLSYALKEGYTLRRLMACFGVDHHVITRWMTEEKLRERTRPYDGRRTLCLTNVDVLEFIQNHPSAFELSRVNQAWFMDLVVGGGLLRRALWREASQPMKPATHAKRERVA